MTRRRNEEQSKILVEFMQQHRELALGHVPRQKRECIEILWNSLTEKLNAKGPPIKDCTEWRKTWADWKNTCQKKLKQPKDGSYTISKYQQAVIDVCGWTAMTVEECESDENSGSSDSSDTPLKITTAAVESPHLHVDPLKQENVELPEAMPTIDIFNDSRCHRNPKQSRILLEFMQLHRDIAKGGRSRGKNDGRANILWEELTNQLNAWGPPTKGVAAWKKVWWDWVISCRKKLALKESGEDYNSFFTTEQHNIIELCGLDTTNQEENNSDEDSVSSSSSSDMPLKTNYHANNTNTNNSSDKAKKRKLEEETADEIYENIVIDRSLESPISEISRAPTPPLANIERTLSDVRAGVATIQTTLQELCKLMAEQNQELKRFFLDSRRHYFIMEKEMMERKRERMK